ncbi:MAG TPA: alpha/beta hydrolase, partial [Vicinamibacterales bacterium]|nr:alpha/beta hydrolase [Vicinamibacterales bacterium]
SRYLLPDMDRLADGYRLIYYDQRGRGRSADGVRPEDVSMRSEVADLDAVRAHFQLPKTAVLGHSWGGVLALEYAIAHPDRVSHLILLNSGPASADDYAKFRAHYLEVQGAAMDRQRAIAGGDAYKAADPDAIEARYRIHFAPAFQRVENLDALLPRMRPTFESGVLLARAVEDRLTAETWALKGYDLRPKLARLKIPTLVVWSDHDFIPFDTTKDIADAIPGARLVTLKACGHFSFLECPAEVRAAVDEFFQRR